jgi:hypothetical protein
LRAYRSADFQEREIAPNRGGEYFIDEGIGTSKKLVERARRILRRDPKTAFSSLTRSDRPRVPQTGDQVED